ncbi:transferase family-domain-containing protein [Aspergillus multicolor]|uniref:transferase family-domain-containing protein n=1 Tax=Aspergillus multicolor TaxID=41759 RepID=UPI003CCCCC82
MTHIENLTPLDAAMPRTYIKVLLVFDGASSASPAQQSVTQTLQEGLDKLVKKVPWLSGRVFSAQGNKGLETRYEEGGRPLLLDKGAVTATATDGTPAQVWPVLESAFEDGAPVFAASVFRFAPSPVPGDHAGENPSQGIGLCVCMHHSAVDATGFTEIIKLWAENVKNRSVAFPSGPEVTPRHVQLSEALSPDLQDFRSTTPSRESLLAQHPEYSTTPPAPPTAFHSHSLFPPCTSKPFTISINWLNTLKELLQKHTSTKKPPSTNTLLCALLWTTITRARSRRDPSLLSKTTSRLVTAVNGRSRLELKEPNEHAYLGNTVLYALTPYPAADLASSTSDADPEPDVYPRRALAAICDRISEAQGPCTINRRHIAGVYALHENVSPVFPGWDLFGSRDVVVTSWADQDLYGVDFGEGLGSPNAVKFPATEKGPFADGVVAVLPRQRGEGEAERIEVLVMLREDDMAALEGDSLWQTLVSW